MEGSYPRLTAKLINPGTIVMSVWFHSSADATPLQLMNLAAVGSVEGAHIILREFACEYEIPAELVEVNTDELDL